LIVRLVPVATYGTVMTTGDQLAPAFGFAAAQMVVLPVTGAPQL
jgi:hypothetical protein